MVRFDDGDTAALSGGVRRELEFRIEDRKGNPLPGSDGYKQMMTPSYQFGPDEAIRPWTAADSRLQVSLDLQIPTAVCAEKKGSLACADPQLTLVDPDTKLKISWSPMRFSNRSKGDHAKPLQHIAYRRTRLRGDNREDVDDDRTRDWDEVREQIDCYKVCSLQAVPPDWATPLPVDAYARFLAKPAGMADWQYDHVKQRMGLESGGQPKPFYYRLLPEYAQNRAREEAERAAQAAGVPCDADYAVYLAWLDWVNGERPRSWQGSLTGHNTIMWWYNYREAIPAPVQESILRSWTAWLMPDRETELDPNLRRFYDNTSGKLVHPMVDDPRVGRSSKDGKPAECGQGDTYHKLTGDWRGNKSYYRSGFTREMSTANSNSSASSGALLCGQIIGSDNAMADGRAGLMQFPFWMWTHSAGVGQEYVDHYYWAIATAGNKLVADFCEQPEDRMAGWSIIEKTVNDLAGAYHPNLRKLMGPASRTYYQHVLGQQDGLYHILHMISRYGALCDTDAGALPGLTMAKDGAGVISQQGTYRCYQHHNRLIMLARPQVDFLNGKQQEIKSLQCTAALFNYQLPAPTWEIYVDQAKIDALPAVARFGQVITIRDGVSYLAIRPLPATDLGRDTEISLEHGLPQEPAHHGNVNIQAALLINAYLYQRGDMITPELLQRAKDAQAGFVVEMGDEKEHGSFERFQAHVWRARLAAGNNGAVTCTTGGDTLAASWDSFTVNGKDPHAYAKGKQLWQDTTLTQMGRARLEKNGAVIDREPSWANMFLQTFPKQKTYVALNLLPNYLVYSFREPGGVAIRADGACSMGRWAVKDSKEIDIKDHAFGGEYAPKENEPAPASVLFIRGAKGKPQVTLNGKAATLKPWNDGWLVALTGVFPKDDEIAARLGSAP